MNFEISDDMMQEISDDVMKEISDDRMKKGANADWPELVMDIDRIVLSNAVDSQDPGLVDSILRNSESIDINSGDSLDGVTLLMDAVGANSSNVYYQNGEGCADHVKHIVLSLLTAGARVDVCDHHSRTVLHFIKWYRPVLQYLLAAGADPNAVDSDGESVIETLLRTTTAPVDSQLQLLIAAGANYSVMWNCEWFANVSASAHVGGMDHKHHEFFTALKSRNPCEFDWYDRCLLEIANAKRELASFVLRRISPRLLAICSAIQSLDLPVLVTLEIVDACFGVDERYDLLSMHAKWKFVAAVKHF